MRILVTGGAGFIGSHLVEYLINRGDEVVVLDILKEGNKIPKHVINNCQLVVGDIRNYNIFSSAAKGCELVLHLAAFLGVDIVADNPIETMDVEAIGMQNLLKIAIENDIPKIVYVSTSGVYGKKLIETAVKEDFDVAPSSSYSIAKRFNEIYLNGAYQEKKINSISTRLFNVYGPRQDDRMVLPRFVKQAINNDPITIFGTGNQTRDFTFIDDVIKSITLLADNVDGNEIFNIARGEDIKILEIARIIKNYFNSKSEIVFVESSKRYDFEVERRFGNSDKLLKFVGYKPLTNIQQGFSATYNKL